MKDFPQRRKHERLDKYHKIWYTLDMKGKRKLKTSFSLSAKCKHLLRLLSERLGISQTSIIEMLVRDKARIEGIGDAGTESTQDTTASQ